MARGRPVDRSAGLTAVLRIRDFRYLWLAEIISDAGSFVTFIALAVYVHDLTGGTFQVGVALALRAVPWVTIGPVAGVIVDRLDRRAVMIACDVARAILVALLPFTNAVWQAYVLSFVSGAFAPAFRPARQALLPLIAPGDRYVRALALSEVAHQVLHTVGPALGGAAVLALGARNAFFLDSVSFFLSAGLIVGVRRHGEVRGRPTSVADVTTEIREGWRVLAGDRLLRGLVAARALDLFALGDGRVALLLIYVTGLGRGSGSFGLALAAAGIGTAAGTVLLGRRRAGSPRRFALIAVVAGSALHVLFLLRPGYTWLLIMLAAGGLPLAGMTLYVSTFVAERVPDAMRGRVFALTGALYEAGDLAGALAFAALGQHIGAARGLGAGGALGAIAVGIAIFTVFSLLRASDRERAVLSSERAPVHDQK